MSNDNELNILIEREFDAPRELVWKMFTEPEHLAQWWGPGPMKTRVEEFDLRIGGSWRYVMSGPDGSEFPQSGVFSEIAPPEKIVTSAAFHYGDVTDEAILTYTFEDLGDKTKFTMHHVQPTSTKPEEQFIMGVTGGWNANWDKLNPYLQTLAA